MVATLRSPPTSNAALTTAWFGSGLGSILLPILIMVRSRDGDDRHRSLSFDIRSQPFVLMPGTQTIARLANNANGYQDDDNNGGNNNNNNDNNNGEEENGTPWWYFGGGGEGEERRDEEKAPPVLIATYLWSVLVFSGLLAYGHHIMRTGADLHGVVVALCLFANFAFISMFLYGGVE